MCCVIVFMLMSFDHVCMEHICTLHNPCGNPVFSAKLLVGASDSLRNCIPVAVLRR